MQELSLSKTTCAAAQKTLAPLQLRATASVAAARHSRAAKALLALPGSGPGTDWEGKESIWNNYSRQMMIRSIMNSEKVQVEIELIGDVYLALQKKTFCKETVKVQLVSMNLFLSIIKLCTNV